MSLRLLLQPAAHTLSRIGYPVRYVGGIPTRSRVFRGAVASVGIGALSLVDPARLRPWQTVGHRFLSATLAGLTGADLAREDPIIDPFTDGVLMAGAALGLAEPAEHLDAWAMSALQRAGFSRPRWVLAGVGMATMAAAYTAAGSMAKDANAWQQFVPEAPDAEGNGPLQANHRAIIERLLEPAEDGTELPGTAVLRTQLETLRASDDHWAASVTLVADPSTQRLVPHQQTWGVYGRFTHAGYPYRLELQISGGRMVALAVLSDLPEGDAAEQGLVDMEAAYDALETLTRMPEASALEIVREQP